MIEDSKISLIVSKIKTQFDPDKIILFGSFAAGNQNDDSDLDLLIVKDTDLPIHQRSNEIRFQLIGSMIPMDILVYTKEEFEHEKNQKYSFLFKALKNSKKLYERKN